MGTYNTLRSSLACPRCGAVAETNVDCHFGDTSQMIELKIGDRYPWVPRKQPQNGGRPENGTVAGEGYMECPQCHKDSFLRVIVRDDVITVVEPDRDRHGYISD